MIIDIDFKLISTILIKEYVSNKIKYDLDKRINNNESLFIIKIIFSYIIKRKNENGQYVNF